MSDSRDELRGKRDSAPNPQYSLREQRRWNMQITQSIWGDSSPSTSPDPIEYEKDIANVESANSNKRNSLDTHSGDSFDKRKQLVLIPQSDEESSDGDSYGPTIAEYEAIVEQKKQEEIQREKAKANETHELQDWEKRRKRKAAMRQAAINASYTPNPWLYYCL